MTTNTTNSNSPTLRVALIGLGAIGRVIAQELQARASEGVSLIGALANRTNEEVIPRDRLNRKYFALEHSFRDAYTPCRPMTAIGG